MTAQEAARKKVANSKLRRLPAYNTPFDCADIEIGDSALFFRAANRKSEPKWGGPACILGIDETGMAAQ